MSTCLEAVGLLERALRNAAPFMSTVVEKGRKFRPEWESELGDAVARMFGKDQQLHDAVQGYVHFALDAARQQRVFEKERRYRNSNYAEVSQSVYFNREYMSNMYLPGLLLSQYLWPHHDRQLLFFRKEFAARIRQATTKTMADIGVGTGFYSRQALASDPSLHVTGFDISEYSLNFAEMQIRAFGYEKRWTRCQQNIVTDPPSADAKFQFVMSVEVLEHLEDPLSFIRALRRILRTDGFAYISAAMTAANEDHIYLYHDADEVAAQIEAAGFRVIVGQTDAPYEAKPGVPAPRVCSFVCQRDPAARDV